MNKRGGYFFVLDVFIASAIIVLTLIIIFSSRVNTPPSETSYRIAEDFMGFLTTTEIRDISNPYKVNLTKGGFINDTRLNLVQVLAVLNYTHAKNSTGQSFASCFLESISNGVVPAKYGMNYSIDGTSIYERNPETYPAANLVLSSRRVTFFRINAQGLYGPVISEVKIWV
jgi:hypothetical protein